MKQQNVAARSERPVIECVDGDCGEVKRAPDRHETSFRTAAGKGEQFGFRCDDGDACGFAVEADFSGCTDCSSGFLIMPELFRKRVWKSAFPGFRRKNFRARNVSSERSGTDFREESEVAEVRLEIVTADGVPPSFAENGTLSRGNVAADEQEVHDASCEDSQRFIDVVE